jgi:hypothetical protein
VKNTYIKTLENTKNTENTIQDTKHRKTTAYTETTKHEHKEKATAQGQLYLIWVV